MNREQDKHVWNNNCGWTLEEYLSFPMVINSVSILLPYEPPVTFNDIDELLPMLLEEDTRGRVVIYIGYDNNPQSRFKHTMSIQLSEPEKFSDESIGLLTAKLSHCMRNKK